MPVKNVLQMIQDMLQHRKRYTTTRQKGNSYKSFLLDLMKNASSNLSFCTEIKIIKAIFSNKNKTDNNKKKWINKKKSILHV